VLNILEKIGTFISEVFLSADRHGVTPFSLAVRTKIRDHEGSASHALEIINDEHTPMDYVVEVLCVKFELSRTEATEKMLQIHQTGKSVVLINSEFIVSEAAKEIESESRAKDFQLKCNMVSLEK